MKLVIVTGGRSAIICCMPRKNTILYAGDSPPGGPANYLLGILRNLCLSVTHVPPGKTLSPTVLKKDFSAYILSDFSRKDMPEASQRKIADHVRSGAGFMMVGGWGSFSGPFGGWRNSTIEQILPVRCLKGDDRLNFPGGALMSPCGHHAMFKGLSFRNPPVICGLNRLFPRKNSRTVLSARVLKRKSRSKVDIAKPYPLLVLDGDTRIRAAAFATDFAPHWCGGMVDWGGKAVKLPVEKAIQIEVGRTYVQFVSAIIRWLLGTG